MKQKQIARLSFNTLAEMNAATFENGDIAFCFETDLFYKANGLGGFVQASIDKHYKHTQGVASATWTIVHNFGRPPSAIAVMDSGGRMVHGDRTDNASFTQTVITFSASFSGVAYLS